MERCKQIEQSMHSGNEIELLDLAARLRQFLLDNPPLIHEVNRVHRLKLTFEVGEFSIQPDAYTAYLSLEDGLDPATRPPHKPRKRVDLDGFLRHNILYVQGHSYSVCDIIKLAANVSGGVHRTRNPDEKQKLVSEFAKTFSLRGLPAAVRQLQAIARVTIKGLRPMIEAVEKS